MQFNFEVSGWTFNLKPLLDFCLDQFILIFPNRTQFMKETTTQGIRTSLPSGRCLRNWQQRKRKNFFVRIILNMNFGILYLMWDAPIYGFNRSFSIISLVFLSPVFLTGSDRVPFMGMESIRMRVAVLPDANELHLPESLTCHCLLLLPIYRRYPVERTMQMRLRQAINHNRGFWKKDSATRWSTNGFFKNYMFFSVSLGFFVVTHCYFSVIKY